MCFGLNAQFCATGSIIIIVGHFIEIAGIFPLITNQSLWFLCKPSVSCFFLYFFYKFFISEQTYINIITARIEIIWVT